MKFRKLLFAITVISLIFGTSTIGRADIYLLNFDEKKAEFLMLEAINSYRYSKGLQLLALDENLGKVSRRHALDMATRNYFDHFTPEGISPDDRVQRAGLPYAVFENIGIIRSFGQSESEVVDALMKGFLESPSHRANLTNPDLTHVGIGFYQDVDGTNDRLDKKTDPLKVYRGYGTVLVVQDFCVRNVSMMEPDKFEGEAVIGEFLTLKLNFRDKIKEAFIRITPSCCPNDSYEIPLSKSDEGYRARFAIDYEGSFIVAIYAASSYEDWFYREQGRFELNVKSGDSESQADLIPVN